MGLIALSGELVPDSFLPALTATSVSLIGFAEGCLTVPVIAFILDTMEKQVQMHGTPTNQAIGGDTEHLVTGVSEANCDVV